MTFQKVWSGESCLFLAKNIRSPLHDHGPRNGGAIFSKGHTQAWKYKEYKDIELGERVQIDHMSATKNGVSVKHFMAWDRTSKHIHAQIYSNAKATSARKFLREFVQTAPYVIRSIQVDGGSEFMAEFETECAALNIPLMVLPPSKPKL